MRTAHPLTFLPDLSLHRLGSNEPAGLLVTSLPWPRSRETTISLGSRPTGVTPLGQWANEPDGTPRRLYLAADGGDAAAPDKLKIGGACISNQSPPTAACQLFERSPEEGYVWERSFLRLEWNGRSVGLAMGLRHNGETHWWEACRMVVLSETRECLTVEMGGAIPRIVTDAAELQKYPGYKSPYLHRHNWLNGHIHARLYANGVCEIFAHHVNSKFFDDGLDLEDVVPVVGLVENIDAKGGATGQLPSKWDGSITRLDVGGAAFDFSEVARLATPEQPGAVFREGPWTVLQPYTGVQMFGGVCPADRTGDPMIFHAEQKLFPRGASRTLRFSLSLNPNRSPRVARYLAPAWWYGICEEFSPAPLLPVSNQYDAILNRFRRLAAGAILKGSFEDGSMPRGGSAQGDTKDLKRYEPGWEGELPYGQCLIAWRTGDATDYEDALRSCWHFTDVAVDHANKLVRMHGYAGDAIAIPMARAQACVAAWLETGDPHALNTAEAIIETSFRLQKNSWPRLAVGRDACFVRGAALLYRYTGSEHFRCIAHEGAMHVALSQRESGSFGDQGGGTGIHQWGGYITKPWMGLLATNGVVDYLELFPDDAPLLACAKKFADWLMAQRLVRDGVKTWAYQHDMDGKPRHYDIFSGRWVNLPSPKRWHQENIGRLMLFCSRRFNEPAYFDAWAESNGPTLASAEGDDSPGKFGDHGTSAAYQFLPWVQARLWNATLDDAGVIHVRPEWLGDRTPREGAIMSPRGAVKVGWKDGEVEAPKGVVVEGAGELEGVGSSAR